MHVLILSDYRYSETVWPEAEAAMKYAQELVADGLLDEVILAGNMLPDHSMIRAASQGRALLSRLFDKDGGIFSRPASRQVTVSLLPGATENTWPSFGTELGPVVYYPKPYTLKPEPTEAEPSFVVTSAEEDRSGELVARNWLARFAARVCGVRIPVSQAEVAARLRQPVQERRAATLEARGPELLLGVIHGGTEPYFGRFGEVWAGCPGGPGWCIWLDTEQPDASQLVPVRRV